MYALIQLRCPPSHRARIIAANYILNALFMIVSSVGAGAMLSAGFTLPQVFLATGLLNALVGLCIFLRVPEYLLRFVAFLLTHGVYRFKVRGDEHLPAAGAALLVCNPVSQVDALLLMAASPRSLRFIIDPRSFAVPVPGWLLKLAKAIPVPPQADDPAADAAAWAAALAAGRLQAAFKTPSVRMPKRSVRFAEIRIGVIDDPAAPIIEIHLGHHPLRHPQQHLLV